MAERVAVVLAATLLAQGPGCSEGLAGPAWAVESSSWRAPNPPAWQEGGITFYYGPTFEGKPLYCGGVYSPATGPWLAVDVGELESGRARCGDLFLVEFADGSQMVAPVRDAGRLASHTVWDSGLPFVADLPRYWRDGRKTATGRILNLSVIERQASSRPQ